MIGAKARVAHAAGLALLHFWSLDIVCAMSSESHPDLPETQEMQLCVSCTAPNEPSAHFCAKCGAPLSSYASTGPFESLFAEGSVYRQAAERPQKLVVVLGVWLIFGTMALGGLFIGGLSFNAGTWGRLVGILIGVALVAVSATMIWKTTRNYLARKKTDGRDDT